MELQDAPVAYFYKLWPKIEANWVRIVWGCGIIVAVAVLISFYSWQRDQREITAGKALTQTMMSIPRNATFGQQVDLYLKIFTEYQGTSGGQRALLQAGATLFAAGKYPEAQAQFQKFLDTYPGSFLAAQASLGLATSLDAQGKADLAAGAYQRIINTYSDTVVTDSARFALAQLDERQGKLAAAADLYDIVTRNSLSGSLGAEAGLHLMGLKAKQQSAPRP
jgi:predicted negative regulator of RcsB-dependent stress response